MHLSVSARLLVLAVVGVVLLSGCTQSTVTATTIDMPDFGAIPASDVLTGDEIEAQRLDRLETEWLRVASSYPNATRPEIAFVSFTPAYLYVEAIDDCYVQQGLTLDRKIDQIGETRRTGTTAHSESDAIDIYECRGTVVVTPPAMNDAQIGYYYDYLTEFLAPCYAANGIDNTEPPTRAEFVAAWPNPGWHPGLGDLYGTPAAGPVLEACPNPYN